MAIDFRKFFSSLSLPLLLLVGAYLLLPQLRQPPPSILLQLLPFLPFILAVSAMLLSWIFHHSREFNHALLVILLYGGLLVYIWPARPYPPHIITLVLLLFCLIPVNYFINLVLRDRGVLNIYGLRRLFLLAIQVGLIIWLYQYHNKLIGQWLTHRIIPFPFYKYTSITQPLLVFFATTLLMLLFNALRNPGIQAATTLCSYLAMVSAMHFYQHAQLSAIFFSLAVFIIIIGITLNAYSLAYMDELTTLPSRRALKQAMLGLGRRYCIAMVDVDHFKKLNDRYGHDVGDQVLRMLASKLRTVKGGKAYRYGGEEFTLLFADKDSDEALYACEELCRKVAASPFKIRGKDRPKQKPEKTTKRKRSSDDIKVTISIGLAEKNSQHLNPQDVIKDADKALYQSKKDGRNRVTV